MSSTTLRVSYFVSRNLQKVLVQFSIYQIFLTKPIMICVCLSLSLTRINPVGTDMGPTAPMTGMIVPAEVKL